MKALTFLLVIMLGLPVRFRWNNSEPLVLLHLSEQNAKPIVVKDENIFYEGVILVSGYDVKV